MLDPPGLTSRKELFMCRILQAEFVGGPEVLIRFILRIFDGTVSDVVAILFLLHSVRLYVILICPIVM